MTANNQHDPDSSDRPLSQNNQMSDDPGDGNRTSATTGREGRPTAAEKKPPHDRQGESAIEAFGREGAGIAAKE